MTTGIIFGLQTSLAPYSLKLIIDNLVQDSAAQHGIYYWGSAYVLIFFLGALNLRVIDFIRLERVRCISDIF